MTENKTILRLKNNVSADLYTLLGTGRVLQLTLKKKWYEMIYNGVKTEEYREIKPYWDKRLKWRHVEFLDNTGETITKGYHKFDYVIFKNGYAKNSPLMIVEIKNIWHSKGFIEWGANGEDYYHTIYLGKILYSEPCA